MNEVKRALISVSNKDGVVELAHYLISKNVEIVSTGGTAKLLKDNNIELTPIEEVTGNPEAFGGRMKTISFQVGSALLFRRDNDDDQKQANELGIKPIDMVVCNLYPFSEVASRQAGLDELIENIDIGGPTMIRAAAKNYKSVVVLTNPNQYENIIKGDDSLPFRQQLALQAYRHTAMYDSLITSTFETRFEDKNKTFFFSTDKANELRYGENPHQAAYVCRDGVESGLSTVEPIQGMALSYNNYLDADAAFRCNNDIHEFKNGDSEFAVTIIKHANPCGCALTNSPLSALEMAWAGDPISSFGSIICFNHPVTKEQALWLSDKFVEVIISPSFSDEVKEVFSKKKNLRLLELAPQSRQNEFMIRSIDGGAVIQQEDNQFNETWTNPTKNQFNEQQNLLGRFGQRVSKHLKSNAIALVSKSDKGFCLVGAGMGNPNRLISLQQAVDKAKENNINDFSKLILISDAFFPFKDNIELANGFGIKAIVQPGGSIKDNEVIEACDQYDMAMAFTGQRHFRH